MDLLDLQLAHFNSLPITAFYEVDLSSIIAYKKFCFYSSYCRHQNWSLPDSIIYYISKNPSSAKVYQKLIQSCKYFFIKNPILIIKKICFEFEKWPFYVYGKQIDLKNIPIKLWITEKLDTQQSRYSDLNKLSSSIIPKFYQVDVKSLNIFYQDISFNELLFLSSNLEDLILDYVTVTNDDGTIVLFENLVKALSKIKNIDVSGNDSSFITSNTVKELLKIPHFSQILNFELAPLPELFDIETLFSYIKKHKHTAFCLYFDGTISEAYRTRLETMIEEVIASEGREYRAPIINFPTLPRSKFQQLLKLSHVFS